VEHTPENPYCDDPACWCHENSDYHAGFTDDQLQLEHDNQEIVMAIEILGDHTNDWLVSAA
jgi:hypothetical protein